MEAVKSSVSGLTYPALVGSRKQSVEDAERMFSSSLLNFMESKGYDYEAEYIRSVLGWKEACDVRGISQLQRCKKNYLMLNFLLKELMPWATDSYDFSYLEVNRFALQFVSRLILINMYYCILLTIQVRVFHLWIYKRSFISSFC